MTLVSEQGLTKSEQAIIQLMEELPETSLRYQALESALAFKGSWIIMAEKLTEIHRDNAFRDWGYKGLMPYCQQELHLSPNAVKKMIRGFKWLQTDAPQYLEAPPKPAYEISSRPPLELQMVQALAGAQDKLLGTPKGEDVYLALKQAALAGDSNTQSLKRQIKEALPDPAPVSSNDVQKKRALRKALTSALQVIVQLQAWDDDESLLEQAEALRKEIADRIGTDTEDAV